MQVTVTFRHVRSSEALREYAEEKIGRLQRYLHRPMDAHVILSVLKKAQRAEVSLVANGKPLFADEETDDLYSAIDLAHDKIERQVKRLNARRKDHKADKSGTDKNGGDPALTLQVLAHDRVDRQGRPEVIRTRRVPAKPLSIEEAVMQMELSNNEFFVFRSSRNEALSVLYRRRDGNYGLIESEGS
jgi:putative sigma-54 modulation protein